jgi:GTP cyclohydrolase II
MRQIHDVGWGCLVYLRQEGRGIGLHAKIQAYNLQDHGADTLDANLLLGHPADARDYGIASEILSALGIAGVCLLTNNPDKVAQLGQHGVDIVERMPLVVGVGDQNRRYLTTKVDRMGHEIEEDILGGKER